MCILSMSFLSQCSVLNNNSTIFTTIKGLSLGEITNRYMFGIPFLHKVHGNNVLYMESTAIWQNLYTVTLGWFQNSFHYRHYRHGVVWEAFETNSFVARHACQSTKLGYFSFQTSLTTTPHSSVVHNIQKGVTWPPLPCWITVTNHSTWLLLLFL